MGRFRRSISGSAFIRRIFALELRARDIMVNDIQSVQASDVFVLPHGFSLDFHSARLTEEQFEELCRNHADAKFELSAQGELLV